MAEQLFGHKYSLIISKPKRYDPDNAALQAAEAAKILNDPINTPTIPFRLFMSSIEYKVIQQQSRELTDLQFTADITTNKNTNGRESSPSKISIYGLSQEIIDFIAEGDIILLSGGYTQDEELPRIFTGEIITKSIRNNKPENIVELTIGQSFNALRDIKVSRSWNPILSPTYEIILRDLISDLRHAGVNFGSDNLIATLAKTHLSIPLLTGYSVSGNIFVVLDKVLKEIDWRYYFVQDVLYMEPKDLPPIQDEFVLVENNLKKSVEVEQTTTKGNLQSSRSTGYKFTLFLDGRATPNKRINVTFGIYKGTYNINSVQHKLDFEGKAWDTIVTCQREGVNSNATA